MSGPQRSSTEHGTGMIGSTAACLVFITFLLFAVQICLTAAASATVAAAGFDAARLVASADVDHGDLLAIRATEQRVTRQLRAQLGQMGELADVTWHITGEAVRLRVRVPAPHVLGTVRRAITWQEIDRTFEVHLEQTP